jgi:glycosyltransferase involved in cell wall biosynthesis
MKTPPLQNVAEKPLVSIILHNTDSTYLRQCFDSILNQTYDNIEICFYDFDSSQKSLDIALEYQQKNPGKITVHHSRKDYFPQLTMRHINFVYGVYFMFFHSCCEMEPELVEKCVNAFQSGSQIAYVSIRKSIVNSSGEKIPEPAIYESSRPVCGKDHIPNLLMNTSPEIISMFDRNVFLTIGHLSNYAAESYTCLQYNLYYLAEPLFNYREHTKTPLPLKDCITNNILRFYQFKLDFFRTLYYIYDMHEILDTLKEALTKQSKDCLKSCTELLIAGDESTAKKLFHLSIIIDENIEKNALFRSINNYWFSEESQKTEIIKKLKSLEP